MVGLIWTGEIDVFVDGKNVISVRGLVFREDSESKVKGMHFQTFFGGTSTFQMSYPFTLGHGRLLPTKSPVHRCSDT